MVSATKYWSMYGIDEPMFGCAIMVEENGGSQ